MSVPDSPTIGGYLVGVLVLVLLMNLIFVPSLLGQVQYDGDEFDAALDVSDHVADHDRPEFVLSEWGANRMYNYFVSGESRSYGYAQSNYQEFVTDENPDDWYDRFDGRVGYVVLDNANLPEGTAHHALFEEFGATDDGVAHYKLLSATESVRTFAVVEGATVETTGEENETVTLTTDVSVGDETFTYERTGTADEDGQVSVRVAYPGEYEIGNETVHVSDQDVYNGTAVTAGES